MAVKFANLASSTLASSLSNTATSISVTSSSSFPTLGSGDYFYASIGETSGSEIVKVTGVSSNTFTVVRGQDGTSAQNWSSGSTIALRVVAAALDDIAEQAQTAADTESVSIDGDTMTGGLILESTLLSRGHSSGDNWMPFTDGNFYIRAPLTIFDNNVRFADGSGVLEVSGDSSANHYLAGDGQIRIRPNGTTINKIVLDASYINAPAYQVGGTSVLTSGRALENVTSISSSGNIVNDIGNSGNDSFIELKNTGYTGNVTSLRQNADSTRAELNSTERPIHISAGSGGGATGAEVRIYANQLEGLRVDSSQVTTHYGLIKGTRSATSAHVDYLQFHMPSWSGHTGYLKNLVWHDGTGNIAAIGAEYDGSKTNIHFHSQYNSGYESPADKTFSVYADGNVNILKDLKINGTTRIAQNGNATLGTISSGSITTSGTINGSQNQNAGYIHKLTNTNTGTSAYTEFTVESGSQELRIGTSQNYASGQWDGSWVYAAAGDLFLKSGLGHVKIYAGDTVTPNWTFNTDGSIRRGDYNGTTFVDLSRNITAGTISSGAITATGNLSLSGDSRKIEMLDGTTNSQPSIAIGEQSNWGVRQRWDSGQKLIFEGWWNTATSGAVNRDFGHLDAYSNKWRFNDYVGINVDANTTYRLYVNGNIRADGAYYVGGSAVIDSSRNLTNVVNATITGTATIPYVRVTGTGDASLSSTTHGIQVGETSGQNLLLDNNEVLSRNNGAASYLHLQADGGTVTVGAGTTANLTVSGTISSGAITSSGHITMTSNGHSVNTRSVLARDTNGLNLGSTNGTTAISIDNSSNVSMPYNLTVTGNLTVSGTTTTIDTANLNVEDNNITLNYSTGDSSASANGAGITIQDAVNSTTDATLTWDATNDEWDFSHGASINGHLLVSSLGAFGNSTLDPDAYGSYAGGFGTIADGSGWVARGLFIHGGATGDAAAIGHNGAALYFGIQNNSTANSMATWLTVQPNKSTNFAAQLSVSGHGNSSLWNTAYGWGDHSIQGYITNATASLDASKITSGIFNSARIPVPANGSWWNNGYVRVQTDGVMEVGKYLDFHTSNSGGNTDFDVRVTATPGAIDIDGDLTVDDITASDITTNGITTTGILTVDTSPAANGTGDLKIIPTLNTASGVGYAGQVIGVNIENTINTSNQPEQDSTWGGVTGATAIALQADDNSYGQFQVWTSPQSSSAGTALTPRFWIDGIGDATFSRNIKINGTTVIDTNRNLTNIGTISSGAITSSGAVSAGSHVSATTDLISNQDIQMNRSGTSPALTVYHHQGFRLVTDIGTGTSRTSTVGVNDSGVFYTNTGFAVNGTTVIDSSRVLQNVTNPTVFINRQSYAGSGISWYSGTYKAWATYMAAATHTNAGPTANITAPSGTLVTSWALRNFIENAGGYGWTFESGTSAGNPSVVAEIRSSDGSARFGGTVNAVSGFAVNGTTVISAAGDLQNVTASAGSAGFKFAINNWFQDSGGQQRFYFEGSNRTFFGSGNGYIFRDSGDTGRATISNYGGVNLLSGGDGQVGSTVAVAVGGTTSIDSSRNVFGVNGSFTGKVDIGAGTIGTRSTSLSVYNSDDSSPIAVRANKTTVFAVLPWSNAVTYLSSGTYYDDGAWIHASDTEYNALFAFSGGTGGFWYASSGSTANWNIASDVQLWNNTGQWTSSVNTLSSVQAGFYKVGSTTIIDASRNIANAGTITAGLTKLTPSGYSTAPQGLAALNIGRAGSGETRAIDIWGSWSNGESKSITFNHGGSSTQMVAQINVAHKPSTNTLGSSFRWGKLYHGTDSSTYTMELHSESTTLANLYINAGMVQIGHDGSYSNYGVIGFGGRSNGSNRIFAHTGNSDGMYINAATGRGIFFRVNGNGSNVFQIKSDGGLYVGASAGTLVLDQSRNLTNINTISSGSVSVTGTLAVSSTSNLASVNGTYFSDGYVTWNAAQFNRSGAYIELQWSPVNSSAGVRIGGNTSNPIVFDAYNGTVDAEAYKVGGTEIVSSVRRFYASTGTSVKAAYSFDGDSTTGMYRPAASEVAFIGGGSEKLRIKSTGELEIPNGRINVDNGGTSFDALLLGGTTQSQYTNMTLYSNSGQAQIWKSGTAYTSYGGASALNIYNSNGILAFHPQGTQNVLQIDSGGLNISGTISSGAQTLVANATIIESLRNPSLSWGEYALTRYGTEGANFRYMDFGYYRGTTEATRGLVIKSQAFSTLFTFLDSGEFQVGTTTVIDASRNGVFERLRADGGNLIMGDEAYSASTGYVGMKTSYMSGSNDYMIISGLSDGNTYVSAKDGAAVNIRGGANNSNNQLVVPDGTYISVMTSNLNCTGNVTAYYSSDESLKTNIRVIDSPLERIKKIRGVFFDWTDAYIKEQSGDGKIHVRKDDVGVIAQDVQPVLDEVVTTREDGTLAVRYEKMIALCIEAIKDQQDQIDSLKQIIEEMKNGDN